MSHTPGPWMITVINAQRQFEIHAEDGSLVALAAPVDRHGVFNTQANAHLIAAAPKLYNACAVMRDQHRMLRDNCTCMLCEACAEVEGG